jgi:hypothetical protein
VTSHVGARTWSEVGEEGLRRTSQV